MVELLAIAVVSVLVLIAAGGVGGGISDRVVGVMSRGISGWRADGWPVGVQEEDPDTPWNRQPQVAATRDDSERPQVVPTLSRVKQTVRIR